MEQATKATGEVKKLESSFVETLEGILWDCIATLRIRMWAKMPLESCQCATQILQSKTVLIT